MSTGVPGGRNRSASQGDVLGAEDDCVPGFVNYKQLTEQHRNVSQSVPRISHDNITRNVLNNCEDQSHKGKAPNKNKVSKKPSMRRFESWVHKIAKHVVNLGVSVTHASNKDININQQAEREIRNNAENKQLSSGAIEKTTPCIQEPPINKNGVPLMPNGQVPGVSGIRNHGNTCFMNAVLQCLNHTDLLAEYFVTNNYKHDVRRQNRGNAKKFGTKGELTEQLAILLKSLWSCQYTPSLSNEFKHVVGKYGSQYRGDAQHDAQEFLLWILDKIHEDLNTASKRRYRPNKGGNGRSDEDLAQEALANHLRCNNSYVYDLFQALHRSSLTCPTCNEQSNTFDPFVCVSLPIPQKINRALFVTVVYLDARPQQVRVGLSMPVHSTVKDLRKRLAEEAGVPTKQVILTEIYYNGFHRTFSDDQSISAIQESDNIYAIETPPPFKESKTDYLQPEYITLLLLNKTGSASEGRRFGCPMVLQIPRDSTFREIQHDVLHNMKDSLKEGIITQVSVIVFRLRLLDGLPGKCNLPTDLDHPLYMPTVDRALSVQKPDSGPAHVKLIVEWDSVTKQNMVASGDESIEQEESVSRVKLDQQQPVIGSLDECFNLYTQAEQLGAEDAWNCHHCGKRQQGTIKKLGLWSLPDILVVHLKRFKQEGLKRNKLNTLIEFPVSGLDMEGHVEHKSTLRRELSPWRQSRHNTPGPDDYVYDLYAVCNHYGNMAGGHYTAFCKNSTDGQWYSFDDQVVKAISSNQIVSRAAYLLFYQRRSVNNMSSASSTSSAGSDHWVYKLPEVQHSIQSIQSKSPPKETTQSRLTGFARRASGRSKKPKPEKNKLIERTINTYGTMTRRPRSQSCGPGSEHRINLTANDITSPPKEKPPGSPVRNPMKRTESYTAAAETDMESCSYSGLSMSNYSLGANFERQWDSPERTLPRTARTWESPPRSKPVGTVSEWDLYSRPYLQESCV
ncbi:unnamed protein product [Owenia fusiformis]|uniref:Ubiquitin carboxyl-terminal hydrolase n=1 Tax=Owenia fusiformis TaxID=6347 RepID=A0A8J1ULD4_OWEFU|nr:unnamed protein product [Owenia fusiformis]